MDCLESIRTRRSVRKYKPDDISQEDLMLILDAGRMAPSAGNLQPCHFIVVKDSTVRQELQEVAFGQEIIAQAPIIIAVCAEPERSAQYGDAGRNHFCLLDCANATENMLLAAHALGYGACWVGGFSEKKAKKLFNLPEDFRVVSLIPVGKADEDPELRPRRDLGEMIHWNKW